MIDMNNSTGIYAMLTWPVRHDKVALDYIGVLYHIECYLCNNVAFADSLL